MGVVWVYVGVGRMLEQNEYDEWNKRYQDASLQVPSPRRERESSLLTTYWSGSTDVFGVPASRHGSLNPLFQVAVYLPS